MGVCGRHIHLTRQGINHPLPLSFSPSLPLTRRIGLARHDARVGVEGDDAGLVLKVVTDVFLWLGGREGGREGGKEGGEERKAGATKERPKISLLCSQATFVPLLAYLDQGEESLGHANEGVEVDLHMPVDMG